MGARQRTRPRGSIKQLENGSVRVRVYAGTDPVTGKRHYLDEVTPAGPEAWRQAEKVRTRLNHQIDEARQPRTAATFNQLLDRYSPPSSSSGPRSRATSRPPICTFGR